MTDAVHYSSKSVEWATPRYLYNWLDRQYHFRLDPCSTHQNCVCDQHFTVEDNGLMKNWSAYADSVFMNPPYGNAEMPCKPNCTKKKCQRRGYHVTEYVPGIEDWVLKAQWESWNGIDVVGLVPARTDTKGWWHACCMKADRVDLIVGRLSFLNYDLGYTQGGRLRESPASFPSALVYFLGKTNRGRHPKKPVFNSLYIDKKTREITVV